ncbi:hypothetical protein OUA97_17660, partial [Phenylobacterium sp. 58.2.17]|nr:hypothetical protein [Phenylobacterium sp. 58.2.17]
MTDPAISEDRLLGGRVLLRQGVRGYRAGMDAALLAAACDAADGARVLEAGCGAGGSPQTSIKYAGGPWEMG